MQQSGKGKATPEKTAEEAAGAAAMQRAAAKPDGDASGKPDGDASGKPDGDAGNRAKAGRGRRRGRNRHSNGSGSNGGGKAENGAKVDSARDRPPDPAPASAADRPPPSATHDSAEATGTHIADAPDVEPANEPDAHPGAHIDDEPDEDTQGEPKADPDDEPGLDTDEDPGVDDDDAAMQDPERIRAQDPPSLLPQASEAPPYQTGGPRPPQASEAPPYQTGGPRPPQASEAPPYQTGGPRPPQASEAPPCWTGGPRPPQAIATLPEGGSGSFAPDPYDSQRPDRIAAAFAGLEERQGTLRDDRERWFRVAILMSLVATVCAGFGIWAAVRSEYVPYIVAVDDLGRVQPVQAPKVIENWPDAAVRRELADLVRDWRSITSDPVVLRQRYRRLQYFLEENSAADHKVRQWAIETRPLTRAETDTVDVAVTSVNFVGGSTWLVEWTENRRSRATGQIDETTRWRGSFVLRKRRITDPAWLTNNPFGMIIEDIDARRLDT